MYYGWSKEFLEAGKRRLAGDTARAATSDEVKELRREAQALKEAVADLTLENRLLKKACSRMGKTTHEVSRLREGRDHPSGRPRIYRRGEPWRSSASRAPRSIAGTTAI
jgi:transposase